MSPMEHAVSRPRKTIQDYLALPDEARAELIGGEILVTPAASPNHQQVQYRIWMRLEEWCRERNAGAAFGAPVDVYLPSEEVVQPDVVFIPSADRGIVRNAIYGVPALVVEVVSPSHPERDRVLKRDLYARNAVPEYWLVELDARSLTVLRLEGAGYRPVETFGEGSILTSSSLPGFALSVDAVFAPLF
jgi:Uma2 family endonuclease